MELCTTSTAHSVSTSLPNIFTSNSKPYLPTLNQLHIPPSFRRCSGGGRLIHSSKFATRATFEEKPSSSSSSYAAGTTSITTDEPASSVVDEPASSVVDETPVTESPIEDSPPPPLADDDQSNDFLDGLNLKLDSEDTYSIVLYGSAALVGLWFISAVVSSIDSIPVIPKLMEAVGLGYSFWFTTRYLLFKENRDELAAKVAELKNQVIGSSDD
ncbi:protein CURVATURE THYLAKOID 1D, chloroplastic [Mercurialis annua]|uniref:protein CURVATURE THYLAKOID 1D, chloroplastic n=1 Tax=Mercurialis annua TaxID=3986 RepID=UPI00215EADE4|nr:protein CURVATURE THYLAKOID 1D, chloroplastic [Mercurialis annua]